MQLEASVQHELDTWANTDEAKNFTIFRTPHNISESKKNFFKPSAVSIGPFHHGQKHLRALEEQKGRFLQDFLSREDHLNLNLCISEMKLLETRTRRCYNETFDDLNSNAFVKMMLLDGCFVLEYFSKILENNSMSLKTLEYNSMSFDEIGWNSFFIPHELLLLENQIPFFIIDKLYDIGNLNKELDRMVFVKSIAYILLSRIQTLDSLDSLDSVISKIPDPPAEIHHLVHLCYHSLVPIPEKAVVLSSKSFDLTRMFGTNRIKGLFTRRFPRSNSQSLSVSLPNSTRNISSMVIPSAIELKQKGMKFALKSNPKHMLDISFEYGVLKIPRLEINEGTKPIFANLMAFEHSKYGKEQSPFTRFVAILDNLVNTPYDVTILQEHGIIENWLGSEAELADFLNQVTEGGSWGRDHYLTELYTAVNRYSESSWHKHRAKLICDYFSSPWSIISLIAALILLVLTCVQSFYAVYAYKYPPSS
ncbi:UPF0481 protein At3g47200-like [Carex rostrata]